MNFTLYKRVPALFIVSEYTKSNFPRKQTDNMFSFYTFNFFQNFLKCGYISNAN